MDYYSKDMLRLAEMQYHWAWHGLRNAGHFGLGCPSKAGPAAVFWLAAVSGLLRREEITEEKRSILHLAFTQLEPHFQGVQSHPAMKYPS